jgi:hypothetical protein
MGKIKKYQAGGQTRSRLDSLKKSIEDREKRIMARDSANQRKSYSNERANRVVGKYKMGGTIKKAQAGIKAPNKRVGPVDPQGAWTKVQEMNLPPRNVKTKVSLTKDKEQGATSMTAKRGAKVAKAKGGKWIQKAIKKPGALRAQLGAKPGKPIPAGKLAKAAKAPGKLGQRARLAQTLKKMKKK